MGVCYTYGMKHWSVDTEKLKKTPEAYAIWELEQMINFGLRQGKIKRQELSHYWNKINLDPHKKKFLALILNS